MKLSKKKENEVYKAISDDIMEARVKIARILQDYKASGEAVDQILYKLSFNAPQKAIDLFKPKSDQPLKERV